jgi:UPF0716 protein FxsA
MSDKGEGVAHTFSNDYMWAMGRVLSLLLLWPLVEIWLLTRLGVRFGAERVLAFILLSGLAGAAIARAQGIRIFQRWRAAEGVSGEILKITAGVLLFLPGVLTDVVGLALLVPPLRRLVARRLQQRFQVRRTVVSSTGAHFRSTEQRLDVVDGEIVEESPRRSPAPSLPPGERG